MIYDKQVKFVNSGAHKYVPGQGYVGDGGSAETRWANVTNTNIQTQQVVFGDVSIESYVIRLLEPLPSDFKTSYVELTGNDRKFKVGQIRHTLKGDAYVVGEMKGG